MVIDAISDYYQKYNANVHRGVHFLADKSTAIEEKSKTNIAQFLGAKSEELIFTRNCTEAINGVAYGWGENNIEAGDIILTTIMEHHANIVPWQELCKRKKAKLEFIQITENGELDIDNLKLSLKEGSPSGRKIKLVALTHVSNVLGIVNDVEKISKLIKKHNKNIRILVDGAQAVAHLPINFSKLGVDFYTFSGHKMLGPMGVGGLLVKKDLLNSGEFRPYLFGGGMISSVTTTSTEFNSDYGLSQAVDYLKKLRLENIKNHSQDLANYAVEKLKENRKIKILGGQKANRLGLVSFVHEKIHAHDLAQVLDSEQIAVRSGHHCCMPLHQALGINASVRVSFAVYNDESDVDKLMVALEKAEKLLL